jgi:hypothetical protein
MKTYFAASTLGFYRDGLHATMPHDAVEISTDLHAQMLEANSKGLRILGGPDGQPIAVPHSIEDLPIEHQARHALRRGLQITSESRPGLNGVYACDDGAVSAALVAALHIKVHGGFPGGDAAGISWLEKNGTPHRFDNPATFIAFSEVISNYHAKLKQVITKTSTLLPPASETIA